MTRQLADGAARDFATDPAHNVVLEASAGTGKTTVLVERYLQLLRAEVAPANILAVTFTRQAAAEMRARIVGALRREAAESPAGRARWSALRDRLGEVTVSTVDAFCLALLREFPLEADLDPDFGVADETEIPRLADEAIDRALAAAARLAGRDAAVAMLLVRLGPGRSRAALRSLLERRLVVPGVLHRFLAGTPPDLTGEGACRAALRRLVDRLNGLRSEVEALIAAGEGGDPAAAIVANDLARVMDGAAAEAPALRARLDRLRDAFLTGRGDVRKSFPLRERGADAARRRYRQAAAAVAPHVRDVLRAFDRDVNVVLTRAVRVLFSVVTEEYQRALRSRALLDFSDLLQRAVALLQQMDEFAQSRYRLESRYHHVLVDEFQDTSRTQWRLVELLVQSWGEGSGLVAEAPLQPTIFVVGDRKQSIYRFRDADVATFHEATEAIAGLRAAGDVRRAISHSFRAAPGLLAFVNDLFAEVGGGAGSRDRFRFEDRDRFPAEQTAADGGGGETLGVIAASCLEDCAEAVAGEVAAQLAAGQVRRKDGAGLRAVRPEDVAILFRARESHRAFEGALGRRAIPAHVYKGLGFFDAEEIKDVRALVRFLASPASELRAAALLRSRLVGLSDPGLLALAGALSPALAADDLPSAAAALEADDRRVLALARRGLRGWIGLVDRLPPAEVLDRVLCDAAYAFELRGPHAAQAQANLGRLRGLVRRIQNRGYATMARVADQLDRLSAGAGMSNAVVEASDAVSLMTVHAAKGLEFPVVFLVDLGRGTGVRQPPVRVIADRGDGQPAVTVWPYRDEAADEERQRDVEETKRLLYVAATRSRDRLYLSAVVADGVKPKFNPGSFGSVLPPRLAEVFQQAAPGPAGRPADRVEWQGASGTRHRFRVCRGGAETDAGPPPARRAAPRTTLLAPLRLRAPVERLPVTATEGETGGETGGGPRREASASRRVGRLFHLLLRRYEGAPVALDTIEQAGRELSSGFAAAAPGPEDEVAAAARLYARFAARADAARLLGGDRLWEVPFALREPAGRSPAEARTVIRRGAIDCLARGPDGRITVLEFKTGRPRPEHRRQLDVYVRAARALFPDAAVDGRLVYV